MTQLYIFLSLHLITMKVVITAITEKGESSKEADVKKTFKEVMRIAHLMHGNIVYGRGFNDGTEIILQE